MLGRFVYGTTATVVKSEARPSCTIAGIVGCMGGGSPRLIICHPSHTVQCSVHPCPAMVSWRHAVGFLLSPSDCTVHRIEGRSNNKCPTDGVDANRYSRIIKDSNDDCNNDDDKDAIVTPIIIKP